MELITNKQYREERFLDQGDNKLSAELSELGVRAGVYPFGRVFDDSIDEGLTLITKEGHEAVFYVASTDRSDDFQFGARAWQLKATPESARRVPRLAKTTLIIFNS